jgi:hypothetical protein
MSCECESCTALRKEWHAMNDRINAAYWRFTRCARAKPPSMVEGPAYARRTELEQMLRNAHG